MSFGARFTTEWLKAHEAKIGRRYPEPFPSPRKTPDAVDRESDLHTQIAAECLRRVWLAFHGAIGKRTRRTPGEPDFVIICEYPRVLLIECKSKTGKPSDDQLSVRTWANKLGHQVHIISSFREFLDIADGGQFCCKDDQLPNDQTGVGSWHPNKT